jgi:hypothetical protein
VNNEGSGIVKINHPAFKHELLAYEKQTYPVREEVETLFRDLGLSDK